jgi:hypothetical protein
VENLKKVEDTRKLCVEKKVEKLNRFHRRIFSRRQSTAFHRSG